MQAPRNRNAHPALLACALVIACVACAGACKPTLSTTTVDSGEGFVVAHVPLGDGWHCAKNDVDKEHFQHRGVKCVYDKGIAMNAKVYDVDTGDARSAELFCLQDWKQAYATVIQTVAWSTHEVIDWHGTPACKVVIEGTSTKGPWHLWEIHAPNGRRMLQISVSGSAPVVASQQKVIDAWLADVKTDLKLPGQ